jgi:hypothetical protein
MELLKPYLERLEWLKKAEEEKSKNETGISAKSTANNQILANLEMNLHFIFAFGHSPNEGTIAVYIVESDFWEAERTLQDGYGYHVPDGVEESDYTEEIYSLLYELLDQRGISEVMEGIYETELSPAETSAYLSSLPIFEYSQDFQNWLNAGENHE